MRMSGFVAPLVLAIAPLAFAQAACSFTVTSPTSDAPPAAPATGDDQGDAGVDAAATPDASAASRDGGAITADAGTFEPAPHPGYPTVPANDGRVLKNMRLVSIVSPDDTLGGDLLGFGDALVASGWWSGVAAEYGLGTARPHVRITGASMPATISSSQMEQYIHAAISGNAAAQPDGNTMYILYLPASTNDINPVNGKVNDASCSEGYAGYHLPFGSGGDAWGFARRCPLQGTGLSELQSLTVAGSHEIVEAATDPLPSPAGYTLGDQTTSGDVWQALPGGGEVGDLCNEETIYEAGYTYTRVWSNAAAASSADPCAPALPVYFAAAPTQRNADGWYAATNGTATIPLTAFSTARASDWYVYASPDTSGVNATVTSAVMRSVSGQSVASMNNGVTGTLTVTGGSPGQSVVVMVISQSSSAMHMYPVGVRF